MARRIALIPEELVSSYHLQKPEIRLEDEIENLLERGKLTDDMKVKLLSQLIMRYHKTVNEPADPVRVTFDGEEKKKILQSQEEPTVERKIESDAILKDILVSVPKSFSKFVPQIVEKLNMQGYSWNNEGELTKNDIPFKKVRIVDFFLYLFRNVKDQPNLREFPIYLETIREINIPRGWIGNKKLAKILTFDSGATQLSSTPKRGRDNRVSESSDEERKQRPRSASPRSQSIYETPIKWGAKSINTQTWKTY